MTRGPQPKRADIPRHCITENRDVNKRNTLTAIRITRGTHAHTPPPPPPADRVIDTNVCREGNQSYFSHTHTNLIKHFTQTELQPLLSTQTFTGKGTIPTYHTHTPGHDLHTVIRPMSSAPIYEPILLSTHTNPIIIHARNHAANAIDKMVYRERNQSYFSHPIIIHAHVHTAHVMNTSI